MSHKHKQPFHKLSRLETVETLLLDMDGTLLDSYFDDYFWEEHVPMVFARNNALTEVEARKRLLEKYQRVESTLLWADVDYWSEQLGLDIPGMKQEINHLIQVHDHALDFLFHLKEQGRPMYLVTNAHSKTLDIKLAKTGIRSFFTRIIVAEEVGEAKEVPTFWEKLQGLLGFNPPHTLLIDDNNKVLRAARNYGLGHLIHIAKPNSKRPLAYSDEFPSIASFHELIHPPGMR